jgi:hypothetical protein
MRNEKLISPEETARKEAWLTDLAKFIVEANLATWAGNGKEAPPQRPGYKELQYPPPDKPQGDFAYRDSYTGYFRAPGMTTIYYKEVPAWTMSFGGHGQTEGYEDKAGETFTFLKDALSQVTPDLPFRGPREFTRGNKRYVFELEGDIEDGSWKEKIIEDGVVTFAQVGIVGIVIHKDANKQPVFPWNR